MNWEKDFSRELEVPLEERVRLLHGPYKAPAVGIGDELECAIRGLLTVVRWSEGKISWPLGRTKELYRSTPSFILCGDLIRAVREESNTAIRYWWGVSTPTVTNWRQALRVERWNKGSKRLFGDWMGVKIPPEKKAIAVALAHSPENIAKVVESRRRNGNFANQKFWTPEREALLGTMNDVQTAKVVGCSVEVVIAQRRRLGITAFQPNRVWERDRDDWAQFSPQKLKEIRLEAGLTQRKLAKISGLHQAQLSRYEQATYLQMKIENLQLLAQALNCEIETLLDEKADTTGEVND